MPNDYLEGREYRCARCLHLWISHGVPTETDYGCGIAVSSMAERERGLVELCGCTVAEGNPVTPRQVRRWHAGTSWPLPPWDRADCGHQHRGPIRENDSQQCLDCGQGGFGSLVAQNCRLTAGCVSSSGRASAALSGGP